MDRALGEYSSWLQAQRLELEETALAMAHGVADPTVQDDPEYRAGLRAAVAAAIDYGLRGIAHGEEAAGAPPAILIEQARRAARCGVGLDVVLRRYVAGFCLFGDFTIERSRGTDAFARDQALEHAWTTCSALLNRVTVAVSAAYENELQARRRDVGTRRLVCVKKLLAGQSLDAGELGYELDAWHLGAAAQGPGAGAVLEAIAQSLDRRLLLVRPGDGSVWAWFGGREKVRPVDLDRLGPGRTPGVSVALGEAGFGTSGWRMTHSQARAALPVAVSRDSRLVRYSQVALLAAVLQDEVLVHSLRSMYLDPLDSERDGGRAIRRTLRAYFAAERNVSSAASRAGVSRQTAAAHLGRAEEKIGLPLSMCATQVETALRLEELGRFGPQRSPAGDLPGCQVN